MSWDYAADALNLTDEEAERQLEVYLDLLCEAFVLRARHNAEV